MDITSPGDISPWLLLVFTLPASKASERVRIWRKLQRTGAIPFRNAGSMLPNAPDHRERFEWLAREIREFKGEASIVEVHSVDDLPVAKIKDLFRVARTAEYEALMTEVDKLAKRSPGKAQPSARLRRRFDEIVAIDFFESSLRANVERALIEIESANPTRSEMPPDQVSMTGYQNRVWITRPRPGIDRVSSAWLIRRFIDPKSKFVFGIRPDSQPKAVPFDMYEGVGFGHQEDRCTFETLCTSFRVTDKKVLLIGHAIHDADLEDERYGRTEGHTINRILRGWATQDVSDDEVLRRGMELIEGLYNAT